MNEYEMWMADKQTSPLIGMRPYRGVDDARIDEVLTTVLPAVAIDEVLTTVLPAVDRAQLPTQKLPTQKEVRADFVPSQSLLWTFDGISGVDQATWMLPAIPKPMTVGNDGQTGSDAQGYLSLAFDMIKSSGIYALGAFASPLVSLVLTPFLTHHFSSTDYGGLSVLYTVVDLVTVITQLGLGTAFFRAYNGDYESTQDRSGVLATSIIILLLISIPIAIAMIIMAPLLSQLLFDSSAYTEPVRLTALVIILENLTLPGISWLRAEKRAIFYSALSIANLLLVLGTNIVLIGVLHMDINGALLAKGSGFVAIVVCTFPIMLLSIMRQRSWHLRTDIARNMLAFGVPTIFSDMAAWVLQLSDRYLLSHFGSLAQTASYTVAYTLGGVLSPLVLAPFGLAWIPVMYAVAKRKDATYIFKLVFRWFSLILLFATFALSLLSTIVLYTLFPPAYHSAAPIIPIIALSTMLMGTYYIFMIGVNIRRKTILDVLFTSIAASVNLVLNIFFIPRFGAIGAAISTLLAYIILNLVTYIVNQKIYPIRFEIGLFIIRLLVGVALYVASSLLAYKQKPLISWSITIGTLLLYGVFLMLLAGLSVKSLKKAFRYVQEARRRKKMYA